MWRFAVLLLAVSVFAQETKPPKFEYPRWGKLYDVTIPKDCQRPLEVPLNGNGAPAKKTCGVFVSFAQVIPRGKEYWNLRYRAWDETSGTQSEDTIYHIYLYVNAKKAWKGITVYGRPTHKIMLEVTYR